MTQEQRNEMMDEARELSARKYFRGEALTDDEQARLTFLADEVRKFDDDMAAKWHEHVTHQRDGMFDEDGNYIGDRDGD